ncbi:MAG: cytochrome b N-terminal domain-containing protein [Patescibacteria group bacterium]|jgi:hypothetical protein|nr:cytochrome b N-terminal domain-containing protein [Patescibacteria group bacterium]
MDYFNYFGSLVNLNLPGYYFHWSILTISLANLIIIAVMVIIFGLAIILPFPRGKEIKETSLKTDNPKAVDQEPSQNSKMLTFRLRRLIRKYLSLDNLIPDHQPAYVSSWIYVFGIATLASLFIVILSGLMLAIGGVNWWHESSLGHFVNSVHLWGVELFMAFMVIHLWGKFWMSAWRGKRMLTWMTGVLAFLASITEAFTGYLSQQNFASQWISTNGKDAINATGLGSFFNLMNFGQIIAWHIVLIPLALVGLVLIHILLVRIKGVVPPVVKVKRTNKELRKRLTSLESSKWKGPNRKYDIIMEGIIATVIATLLIVSLAFILSSPDDPALTISNWAKMAPADFVGTVLSELNGTSETAQYGPPYNYGSNNLQKIGGLSWQLIAGVHQQINPAQTFVLGPLEKLDYNNLALSNALKEYTSSSKYQRIVWLTNYSNVLPKLTFKHNIPILPKTNDGPVPEIIASELGYARSGAINASLLSSSSFYGSNYSKPLLFIEDGNYFTSIAKARHLYGTQWGVMNETGSYPGQPWLWFYSLWYQIPAFSTSTNVDLIAIYLTAISTILLLLVPFIPGIRDIPKIIPIYKLIWRRWYKKNLK